VSELMALFQTVHRGCWTPIKACAVTPPLIFIVYYTNYTDVTAKSMRCHCWKL